VQGRGKPPERPTENLPKVWIVIFQENILFVQRNLEVRSEEPGK